MKNVINYSIRILLIVIVIFVANSSTNVYEEKVENSNVNKTINLSTMALKVIEANMIEKFTAIDTYTGDLTGYAHNCPLCGGTLACKSSYNVKDGTTTYPDSEYGEVYIVASSRNLPCGSIISFNSNRIQKEKVLAIVLDRGVLGNALDLLVVSEDYASDKIGRSSITYDVLRSGWE